jgi:hypothetical protein
MSRVGPNPAIEHGKPATVPAMTVGSGALEFDIVFHDAPDFRRKLRRTQYAL